MPIGTLFSDPVAFILFAIVLIFSLSWHEAAHAFIAKRLGDDTAEHFGRLTLNPLAHLDPIGTILIFVAGVGWGKPVPVNPNNFDNPLLDNFKVALAGPVSNLILAAIFAAFFRIFHPDPNSVAGEFTQLAVQFNLIIMLFNLIPIPPLDGSKVVALFMSESAFEIYARYGLFILLGLILLDYGNVPILSSVIFGPVSALTKLLLGFAP